MEIQFRNNLGLIFVFSVLLLGLLMLARVGAIAVFGSWQDIGLNARFLDELFFKGFRFDLKLLSSILILFVWLPVLVFSWLLPRRIFRAYLRVALILVLILLNFAVFLDIGHLYYYQRPVDVLVFGLFEDDTGAIITTILANYLLVLIFAGFIVCAGFAIALFSWLGGEARVHSMRNLPQILIWFVSLVFLVLLARGSVDTFPLQRKHASVSDSSFLNSMVMNSAFNLYYAYRDKRVNNQQVFSKDILGLHELDDVQQLQNLAGYDDQNPLLRTTARNARLEQVRPHVIFVAMESWSSQTARAHSATNQVLGEFAAHAGADHFFTQFFTSQYATNPSLEMLLLNSPITPLSQSVASQTAFQLSNLLPFKRQNYQTLFLSGGYSSWRNHNKFWLLQGFDGYVGRSEIENHFQVDASDNPWGVYDEYLFEYLKKSLQDAENQNQSLFSFVLTTNNHSPVRLPKSYVMPPLDPSAYGLDANDLHKKTMLSGYHYQTDQLGRFISWVKNSDYRDKVIIVATGDHPQRKLFENSASAQKYLRYSVPAYFYVPTEFDRLTNTAADLPGSHGDLFPTLFELSLSQAQYYNFGQPFTEKRSGEAYGWSSSGEYIFAEGVVDSRNEKFYAWADENKLMLDAQPRIIPEAMLATIKRETYRRVLKQYFIVQDYRSNRR